MKKVTLLAALLSITMVGCSSAPKSNEVSAAYVSVAQYNNFTCEQLMNEVEAIRRSTPALEAAVDKHRSNQTGVEIVTWVLFWPAALALDKGEEYSAPLAKAKGELQAIQSAMMTKNCSVPGVSQPVIEADARSISEPQVEKESITEKLKTLENMRKENLITEDEYTGKRKTLIDQL